MFVLDTNVVSELRKAKAGRADRRVVTWAKSVMPESLYISAVTVLELEAGVLRIERRDAVQGKLLRRWLDDQVIPSFAGRILAVDVEVARRCARLQVPDKLSERDALIAASAAVHEMTVVTRNVADFAAARVALFNPWREVGSAD